MARADWTRISCPWNEFEGKETMQRSNDAKRWRGTRGIQRESRSTRGSRKEEQEEEKKRRAEKKL